MSSSFSAQVKIRYNHPGSKATVTPKGKGELEVRFEIPQKAITPGQAAVVYEEDRVLGGGWIKEVLKSAEWGVRSSEFKSSTANFNKDNLRLK
jgi:tRNA-specific 2-thiouridylase